MWRLLAALLLAPAAATTPLRFAYDPQGHPYDVACARDLFGAAGVDVRCFELADPYLALDNGEADVVVVDSTTFGSMVYGWSTHFHLDFAQSYLPSFDIAESGGVMRLYTAWKSGAIDGAFCRAELCEDLYADGARLLMSASLFGSYSQPTWTMLVTSRAFAAARGDDLAAFLGVAAAADAHYIEEGAAGKSSYWPVRREDEFLAAIADAHEYLGPGTSRYDPADSGDRSHVQQTLFAVEILSKDEQLSCAWFATAGCTASIALSSMIAQAQFLVSRKIAPAGADPALALAAFSRIFDGSYLNASADYDLEALMDAASGRAYGSRPADAFEIAPGASSCAFSAGIYGERNATRLPPGSGAFSEGSGPNATYGRKWACAWLLEGGARTEIVVGDHAIWHGDALRFYGGNSSDGEPLGSLTGAGAGVVVRHDGPIFVEWLTASFEALAGTGDPASVASIRELRAPLGAYAGALDADGWAATYDSDAAACGDCSGRGACDAATGLCRCDAGFGGGDCAREACFGTTRAPEGATAGSFASQPGAPLAGTYDNDLACAFAVAAAPGRVVVFEITYDLQETFDFLSVVAAGSAPTRLTGAGAATLAAAAGDDGEVRLELLTDAIGRAGGFAADFYVVDAFCDHDATCGGRGACGDDGACACDVGWTSLSCGSPRCAFDGDVAGDVIDFASQPEGRAVPAFAACASSLTVASAGAVRFDVETFDLEPDSGDAMTISSNGASLFTLRTATCEFDENCGEEWMTGVCADGLCGVRELLEVDVAAGDVLTLSFATDRSDDGHVYGGARVYGEKVVACAEAGGRCPDNGGVCVGGHTTMCYDNATFHPNDCSCETSCDRGCPDGTYAPDAGSPTCTSCPANAMTSGVVGSTDVLACNCMPGHYSRTWPVGDCKSCDGEYATCDGGLAQPFPDRYYWTNPVADHEAEVLRCRFTFVCLGGSRPAACAGAYAESHNGTCRGPWGEPLALEAPEKWCDYGKDAFQPMCEDLETSADGVSYWSFSTQTYRCPAEGYRTAKTALAWFLLFLLFIFINDVVRPRFSVLDVVLDSFQDLGVISGFWLYWPPQLDALFAIYNIALFDVDMYLPSCSFPVWGFTHTFYLMIAMPLFYGVYGVCYTLALTDRGAEDWLETVGSTISFLFGSTPSLLSYTLGTFACRDIVGYGSMLVDAPEESCSTTQVANMRLVAVVYLAVLVVGVPALVLGRMWYLRKRNRLCEPEARRASAPPRAPPSQKNHAGPRVCVVQSKLNPFLEPVLNLFELLGLCMSILVLALGMLTTSQGLIAEASETRWWVFLFYVSQAGYVGLAVRFATAEVNDVASQNYASRSITTALRKLASPTPRPSLLRKMSSRLLAPSSPSTPPKLRIEGLGVEETKVADPTGSSPSWRALGGVAARVKRDASRTVVAAGAAGVAAGTLAASGAKSAVEAVGIDVDRVIGGVSDVTGTLAASGANQDLELVRTFKGPMLRSFCMSPYFRDGGAAVLDEWVALEAIMKPYVADTSITNNYSNSHEARFYRNILDAVPVLLEVMVDAGEDARRTIAAAIHLLSEETRRRDQWGASPVIADNIEGIDRPSRRAYSAYLKHRSASNIQRALRKAKFRAVIKAALATVRKPGPPSSVSLEVKNDDATPGAYSFTKRLFETEPVAGGAPEPICSDGGGGLFSCDGSDAVCDRDDGSIPVLNLADVQHAQ
ncbi:hypothetical protein SO694_00049275 [Aureococcus anophagefferens]|uniref:CUB domain-containing protein n=1 Tax=Aureococcus anophagefferens TaxID=44056 RepID=A0ABR1G908_AURAN